MFYMLLLFWNANAALSCSEHFRCEVSVISVSGHNFPAVRSTLQMHLALHVGLYFYKAQDHFVSNLGTELRRMLHSNWSFYMFPVVA
jgi:hypothetical protein